MQLAKEEERIERAEPKDRVLRAYCTYKEHPEVWEIGKPEQGCFCLLKTPAYGVWTLGDGVSENFQERFRVLAARAGVTLGSPNEADPEDFWLHRLFLDLRENNSDQLFAASDEGGVILRVCEVSATFCARLERKAITGEVRLRTDGEQAESSRVQNNADSTQNVESKSMNAAPDPSPEQNLRNAILKKKARIVEIERILNRPPLTEHRGRPVHGGRNWRLRLEEERQHLTIAVEELEAELAEASIRRAIASRKRMESSVMPGISRHANTPELNAQRSRSLLGIDLADLENLRREVRIKFFDGARLPPVVEAELEPVLSSEKMPDPHVDLALTFVLTKEYVNAISRASAQLADLLVTAALSRISQAHFREAIWRECLDFAYQLGQWDAFVTWVDRVVHFHWQVVTADGTQDREQLEKAAKPRREFFDKRIGMYSQEWLSAIDRAINMRRTVSAPQIIVDAEKKRKGAVSIPTSWADLMNRKSIS
jgi:hypothetical protein